MDVFTPIEVEFCKNFITKLLQHPLCVAFIRPVDPERDNVPDYLHVIKSPMDLGTVSAKLNAGEYVDSADFYRDVDLVWANALSYHKRTKSFLFLIAQHMKEKCEKASRSVPKTEVEDWNRRFQKANRKLNGFLRGSIPLDALVPRNSELAIA
jgi:hypothetical protein